MKQICQIMWCLLFYKKLEISINGKIIETRPLEPNFNDEQFLRSYLTLYKCLGKLEDWALHITLEE
jgi:hypothetical protein